MRNQRGCWQYKSHYAQTYADERHKNKPKRIKFTKTVEKIDNEKIQFGRSPEQISGYAKRENLFSISHECIYQYILRDKQKGGTLYKNLRHQSKRYRKRYGSPKRQGAIRNRRFIDLRPSIVDEKKRLGDWEIDTIIGKNRKQAIVTLVERVSKTTILSKVKAKKADLVSSSIISSLKSIVNNVLTITADNGSEFAYHEKIGQELETEFYFAHPYSSWERGLNENTNGLIRQYLKKRCDFSPVTDME